MNWLTTALASIFFYSTFDLFVKLSSSKINSGLGNALINVGSLLTAFIWYLLISVRQGDTGYSKNGIVLSLIAGVLVGLAGLFFIRLFSMGVNLSVGVPLVRVGMIVLGSLFGILLLKEGVNLKFGVGFILSLLGLYLVMTAK